MHEICVTPTSWRWTWRKFQQTMNITHSMPWKNPCRHFINDDFFGPLRLSPSNWCEVNLDNLDLLERREILECKMVTGLQSHEGNHVNGSSTMISSDLLGVHLLTSVKWTPNNLDLLDQMRDLRMQSGHGPSVSWRTPCKRFVHDDFFGPLRCSPSH